VRVEDNLTVIHSLITTFAGGIDSSKRLPVVTWQIAVNKNGFCRGVAIFIPSAVWRLK
jgi:hypothetical protein